jgi:protein O-mannosyl-transferase
MSAPAAGDRSALPSIGSARPDGAILLAAALIALAAVAVYRNSFAGVFVFDDVSWITQNSSIRHLWPIWQVLSPADARLVGGRPVVSLTLAVNYALGGMNVWGYHAVNLAIHLLAAWTLFGVTRRTLVLPHFEGRFASVALPLALVAALLWMIHPLQTEAVTYIVQRTEALVALFYLLTLYCVIRGATAGRPSRWYLAATMACLLGMATKEVMATAPLLVLLYDRTFLAGSFREALRRRSGLYLALAATWGMVLALLISTGFHGGTTGFAVQDFTCWSYLSTQPGVIVRYLRLAFWPTGLCLDYGWPPAKTIGQVVIPGIPVVALLALTVWALVKRPAWGFLGACFFVILAPSSSFIPILDAAFEHRMYLPLAAVVVGAVMGVWCAGQWLVRRGTIRPPTGHFLCGILAVFAVSTLGVLTSHRNADYRDGRLLWEDTVAKACNPTRAYNNLGIELATSGRHGEAIALYQKSLALTPNYAEAHYNLGMALAELGQLKEAIAEYEQSLKLAPNRPDSHNNLGLALVDSGRLNEAIAHYRRALELKSDDAGTHNNLGVALVKCRQFEEAVVQYQKAIELTPDSAGTHGNLAMALVECGRLDEAVTHYEKALELNPDSAVSAGIHNNLGMTLAGSGRIDEAIVHFRKALEIKPDYPAARHNLDAALGQKANAK